MIVYCDSSVLLKRVFDEADAAEFRSHFQDLIDGGSALATSALGELEVSRVCRRYFGDDGLRDARAALEDVAILAVSRAVLRNAAEIPYRHLRSADAIHVASAFTLRADLVLTRDRQMRIACEQVGIRVA